MAIGLKRTFTYRSILGSYCYGLTDYLFKVTLEIDYRVQYPEVRQLVKVKLKLKAVTPKLAPHFHGCEKSCCWDS